MSTQFSSMEFSIRHNARFLGWSKRKTRLRMTEVSHNNRKTVYRIMGDCSSSVGLHLSLYRPNHWAIKRQAARARKASITQASKILGVSKSDARVWKERQVRNRDKLNYFQPNNHNLRLGKLTDWASKRAEIRAKRYPQNKHLWPDFVRFEVETVEDGSPDLSCLGRFTDTWQPGAIFHSNAPSTYRYFVPACSYAYHVKSLHDMGYSKDEANYLASTYVQQDYKRMKEYGESWSMVGVIVKAYIGDIEIGCDSRWGIEDDAGNADLQEVIEDRKLSIWHDLDPQTLGKLAGKYHDLGDKILLLALAI